MEEIKLFELSPKPDDEIFKETLLFYQKLIALSFGLWIPKSFENPTEEEIRKLIDLYYEKERCSASESIAD